MKREIKYGSVCSGIEAATVAWKSLGWKASFLSEIEPFPRSLLAHRYPEIPLHGDFTTIQDGMYEPINLLVGGTPCQSFSVAGLRAGLDDPRGNLMLEFGALARRLRPEWMVWENVPGVLSSNGGRDFGTFLGMLGELGYGFSYRVLDAQHFGVPQRRRRVFVVGYFGDWRSAAAVLFERHSLSGHLAPSRKAGQAVAGTITKCSFSGGAGGRPEGAAGNHFLPTLLGGIDYENNGHGADEPTGPLLKGSPTGGGRPLPAICFDVAPTLDAHYGDKMGLDNQHINSGGGCSLPRLAMCLNAGAMGRQDAESETLIPVNGGGFDVAYGIQANIIGRQDHNGGNGFGFCENTAPTLTKNDRHAVAGMQVRRITPTECERLQGFEDGYTLVPYRGKPSADGPRYKALGNSMAVPVMRWIGERIQMVDEMRMASEKQ